jgi:hypothetical protein
MLEPNHLKKNNVSYWQHLVFALPISCRLFFSGIVLAIHSVLPVLVVPDYLNLENIASFLQKKNEEREKWTDPGELGEDWF